MDKSVLISIRPEWCELIASGEKTIEVRKTRPKLETPFKCYIYCTRDKHLAFMQNQTGTNLIACMDVDAAIPVGGAIGNGKVIGEFTCDWIQSFDSAYSEWAYTVAPSGSVMPMHETKALELCQKDGCLSDDDVLSYFGDEDWKAYFWHISDLRIYDTPRKLSEFIPACRYKNDDGSCQSRRVACSYQKYDYNPDGSINLVECGRTLERPPQSWCYVREDYHA